MLSNKKRKLNSGGVNSARDNAVASRKKRWAGGDAKSRSERGVRGGRIEKKAGTGEKGRKVQKGVGSIQDGGDESLELRGRDTDSDGDSDAASSFASLDDGASQLASEKQEPRIGESTNGESTNGESTNGESTNGESANGESASATRTFADLGVTDSLCDACTALNFQTPTAIQREAIPLALAGKDIIGLAETGSGKTAAFALPILQALLAKPAPFFGLVLAPTRELAYQISQQFEALGALIGVRCAVLVGGMDMVPQAIALAKKPHILVATPGRLMDHLENTKGFSLRTLQRLVLDEADRLLDLDFGPILDKILPLLPRDGRQTMLFSATMNTRLSALTRTALQSPVRVSISTSAYQTVANLQQHYCFLPHKFKDIYLLHILHAFTGQPTICFARTVHETQRLAFLLRALGLSALPLHGQMPQSARLGALNKFRAGGRDILVATDVAARGLDIPLVDLVINFDLPPDSKTYVHRVGRTARAGKAGTALSLVTQYDVEIFQRIERALGRRLDEWEVARDEVMVFAERVGEAQRVAVGEMKGLAERERGRKKGGIGGGRAKGRGKAGGGRDEMDRDEG